MKAIPNENFLTGSERQGSEKEGEGEVEKKRGEVSLRAIPGHYQAPRYLMRGEYYKISKYVLTSWHSSGQSGHGTGSSWKCSVPATGCCVSCSPTGSKNQKNFFCGKKWSIELLTFDRKVIGRVTIPRNDPV